MRALLFAALLGGDGCAAQVPPPAPAPQPAPAAAPQDPLLRERAAAAENLGRFAEAADHYLQLMQREPLRAEWAIAAGRCLGRSGRFNDAINLLSDKRHAFPGVVDVSAMLARTFLLKAEGDAGGLNPELAYQDAARLADEVLAVDANHEEARLILAQARYGLGDVEGAAAAAADATQRFPQRAGAHVLVARIAFDRFKAQKRALEQSPPADDAVRAERVAALDVQRKLARAEFQRAAELDPRRTFAHIALAELAIWDHEPKAALQHWGDALAVDPQAKVEHAWIEANTAWDARREFYRQAAERYRKQANADPKLAATLDWYEARAACDGGQWHEARVLFDHVAAANRDFTNAYYWAGVCAWRIDDHDGADRALARYAAISATDFADVLRALAPEARAEMTRVVQFLADRAYKNANLESSRDLNHVIAALRDSADAWNNYAFLCRESGRFRDAVAGYQHALEKEPDSPQLRNDLAVVLHYHLPSDENLVRARALYTQAIDLADRVLADDKATAIAKQRATQARSDAQQNLAKLP